MNRSSLGRGLARDRRGGVTFMLASSLFMLAGAATVAVDLGSVYLARRQLQGVADAAALAAADGGRTAAEQMVVRSGVGGVALATFDSGSYVPDPAVPIDQRFRAGDATGGAIRVEVRRRTPLFFARLLVGRDGVDLSARATAARSDAAAFSLGTGLASLSGGLPNMLLSNLAGTELNLSVMDYNGLLSANLDLLRVADALRVRTGRDGEPYGALFDREIPLADLLGAMADGAGTGPASATLLALSSRIPGRSIRLSDIIDLGPMRGAASATGQPNILLDAFSMLRMVLSPPSGTSVPMDLHVAVPGLTSTRLMLVTGEGQTRSPLMSITAKRDVVLRTGQARIYLETSVATALSGIASVRIPLYIELAAAEARLSDIRCGNDGGVTLAVTPSVGSAVLGDIDVNALTNFSVPANPRPALLAQTIGTRVTGYANISLGGTQSQSVFFSPADISAQQAKTVSTRDVTQGIAASLTSQTQIQVSLLGITVGNSPLSPLVGAVLGTTAPLLDGILNSVTATLGVRVGSAEVRVHQRRCGMAAIVA
ncbi:pilus assembly protein TadG-related protein [Sphingobium sp. HWE2-09]|uniref:pilus assembly protein TadG-related protein n=1 Tax=Sphingobium sp. HWE2-09 TaxID=3108390 RepID=UPI002DD0153A|nr:pilus assembly protein TadG-related protein [Sphingobium sp. HWE2-09]